MKINKEFFSKKTLATATKVLAEIMRRKSVRVTLATLSILTLFVGSALAGLRSEWIKQTGEAPKKAEIMYIIQHIGKPKLPAPASKPKPEPKTPKEKKLDGVDGAC